MSAGRIFKNSSSLAPTLMIQGTASSVGKSLLVGALGRIFTRRGLSVAPFKAQNMALNADVTPDGLEIGRAQSLQARACNQFPEVAMNPILIKPEADDEAQIVVLGRSRGRASAMQYHQDKTELRAVVVDSLQDLRSRFDLIVIEGAGSPAEINLRDRDLVNMFVAHAVESPVLLAGDIDRGGVFAHLVGTLALLDPRDRSRVAGLIINKFRGDMALLRPGLVDLERLSDRPVLGVVPYIPSLRLADEDSLSFSQRNRQARARPDQIEIAILQFPLASNMDDFDALAWEHDVVVRHISHPAELEGADLVVLPGSKASVSDLDWLRESGLDVALIARAARGEPILGVCGGCQILGEKIFDPLGIESSKRLPSEGQTGLGLLPLETHFEGTKCTRRVYARAENTAGPWAPFTRASGYYIHAGRVRRVPGASSTAWLEVRSEGEPRWERDGAVSVDASGHPVVFGTMLHGLFENETPRRNLLDFLASRRGRARQPGPSVPTIDQELDRIADGVENALDMDALERLVDAQR